MAPPPPLPARLRPGLPAGLLLAVVLAATAGPAAGEIYRWRDADGREHFTSDIHQVPAAHRREARENARGSESPVVNYHRQPLPPARTEPAEPPAKAAPNADSQCEDLRKLARKKLKEVAKKERAVARREDAASDIAGSVYAERRIEIALAKARQELEAARDAYEQFRRRHYSRGIPPGCLR